MKAVAKVAAFRDGRFLMGKRRDNGKWNMPGGHLEPGESPHTAGVRELGEETGLHADLLHHLGTRDVKGGKVRVHAFRAEAVGEPRAEQDPDGEFSELRWMDPEAMPGEVMRNLHSDPDVVLELIGAHGSPWASFDSEAA